VAGDDLLLPEIKHKWQTIIVHMQKVRAAIASHLSSAVPVSTSGNVVTIGFAKKNYFDKEVVESAKNLKFIETTISNLLGRPIGVKFALVDTAPEQASADSVPAAPGPQDEDGAVPEEVSDAGANENDFINDLLDTFKGNIHTGD